MFEYNQDNLLIVCPNEEKMRILDELNKETGTYDIKFMTKEEYKRNYYFSYDEKAYFYLLQKYHYNLDVAKVYLESLYLIDETKTYTKKRLNFLKNLKIELKEHNLIEEKPGFKDYIKKKKIIVKNYYDLDKYEEEMLQSKLTFSHKKLETKVVEYQTLEEEVNGVCLKILELLKKKVDINHIYLTNVTQDYFYTIKKLFAYYKIPINLDEKESIYSTKVVKDYLNTKEIDLNDPNKNLINKKLISILSQLIFLEEETEEYQTILIDKLKNTYLPSQKLKNAVNIKNLYNETFSSDSYVFVLGFNQDSLPKLEKDTSFLNDTLKDEISSYKTPEKNSRNKLALIEVLSSIQHLYLSYKLSSPFSNFYKSSIIDDLKLEIVKNDSDSYEYSNLYNKLRLAEKLDLYYLYGEKDENLNLLYTHYSIPYKTYSNSFSGIDKDKYLEHLPYPLNLSYTSLNAYSECRFKYYIKYVLKLDSFTDSFATFLGSMYHHILSLYLTKNFDFEEVYNKYLEKREVSLKERMLLIRIKKDLEELLQNLKQQQLLTGFDNAYFEQKIEIPLNKKVETIFMGYIDKIMYYQKIEDTYFSIIDYKTGFIDTNIEPMKYGLHMQLPVYLYLIHYSKVFKNPIFTGIYYQNILYNYPTWNEKNSNLQLKDRLKLQGYSTDDSSILAIFDSTYEKSEYIKSMSYNEEKGFGTYSKIINNDTLYQLIRYTKNYIEKTADEIIEGDFSINPKIYAGKNIACEYCDFKDLCYHKESDNVYLNKVEDLSFLGGEE